MCETILINANIYTMDEARPKADTIVIKGNLISYVGNGLPVQYGSQDIGANKIIDLNGKTILPGLVDSHTHPGAVAQSSWHISLPKTDSLNEILSFVKEFASDHPKEEIPFLYFEYYPSYLFDKEGPKKEILDEIVNDRPCLLQDFGDHLHWVNSKMLELMGVNKDTPDPVPGIQTFQRNLDGSPTGWIKEMAWFAFADELYEKINWRPPIDFTPDIMRSFFAYMTRHGVTSLVDALIENESQIKAIRQLDDENQLNMYYEGAVRFLGKKDLPKQIEILKSYREKYSNKHIQFNTMKLFLDGSNESGNAAILEPLIIDDSGENYGEIAMDTDELTRCILICNDNRLDIHLHVVGDRAFRVACDAYENALKKIDGRIYTKMILAHCELVDPKDMARPGELGITVNWTPHWSGGYFGKGAIDYLGQERWNRMYRFNEIIDSGALVTFSSDVTTNYELHRADPMFGMEIGIRRKDPENDFEFRPLKSATLNKDVLIRGYTLNGAKQMKLEDKIGSLEKGKIANFVVLDRDYFKEAEDSIHRINILATIFEGKPVYGNLKK